jgi:hypothetical protein
LKAIHNYRQNTSDWAGGKMYHNHPVETLSENDVYAIDNGLHSFHVVTPEKVFSAITKNDTLPKMSFNEFSELLKTVSKEYSNTLNSKEYDYFRMNMQSEEMRVFCKMYSIIYKIQENQSLKNLKTKSPV